MRRIKGTGPLAAVLVLTGLTYALLACGGGAAPATTVPPVGTATLTPEAGPTSIAVATATIAPTAAPRPTSTPVPTALTTSVPATVAATATAAPTSTLDPTPVPTSISTTTATPAPTPAPTLAPTNTPEPTPTRQATSTPMPTATLVPAPVPLAWPSDVGTSHFGQLGDSSPGFPGAWIRPHAGRFIWGLIEPQEGQYFWRITDSAVRSWQRDRLATLVTIWPFASWDQNACHGDQPRAMKAFKEMGDRLYSPCDLQAYAAWLDAVVERYDGDGVDDMSGLQYPVRHWEVLNEPEMQGPELTFFQEDSAAYLDFLKRSYTAIRAADPNAVVLTGGQAGMQPDFVGYWRPVLAGGGSNFDVGNVHSIGSDEDFFAPSTVPFWTAWVTLRSRFGLRKP